MKPLKLGIAGLGHVGTGLISLVTDQAKLRLGGSVEITGVSARTRNRARPVAIDSYKWFDDPVALATSPDVTVFVELIGGSDGPALAAVEAALNAGKHVVTANKAMIAKHGFRLAALARDKGVDLMFEAAVAGAVPVVRVLRDSLAGTEVTRVTGILNGTCNFLTTEMLATGRSYEDVLADAQRLGYAEADPFLDVSGTDAAQKIAILSAIAFSADLDFDAVSVSGVDTLGIADLTMAQRLDLSIKLIAEGLLTDEGVVCRVAPLALPLDHSLAQVNGSLNTARIEGKGPGAITITGAGAGSGPTASAVMGDVAKLFTPTLRDAFGRAPHHTRRKFVAANPSEGGAFFLSLRLADRPGALAGVTEALAACDVSVDRLFQDSAENGTSGVAIVTHLTQRQAVIKARDKIASLDVCKKMPLMIRVEN